MTFEPHEKCIFLMLGMFAFQSLASPLKSSSNHQGPLAPGHDGSFSLGKSESGLHSAGSRGNHGESSAFTNNNNHKINEIQETGKTRTNSYATVNAEEVLDELIHRRGNSNWRYRSHDATTRSSASGVIH